MGGLLGDSAMQVIALGPSGWLMVEGKVVQVVVAKENKYCHFGRLGCSTTPKKASAWPRRWACVHSVAHPVHQQQQQLISSCLVSLLVPSLSLH